MSTRAFVGRFLMLGLVVLGIGAVAALLLVSVVRPGEPVRTEVVQDGLDHPWDLAFAPDGRMVVTERVGRVRVFAGGATDAALLSTTEVPDVRAELESGLMGIAMVGDEVFVCASRDPGGDGGAPWTVDLLRTTLSADSSLSDWDALPIGQTIGGPRHQGCALEAATDGTLWMSIGDALRGAPAQDPSVLNGKVLHVERDGSPVGDTPIVSMGHRNPQGLAIRADGTVFEVEHGTDVNDEINLIVPGGNYGYPCLTGASEPGPMPSGCPAASNFFPPAWASGSPTLATSGATFLAGPGWADWEGNLLVTTLKEEDLRRFSVADDGALTFEETLLDGRFGRLRGVVVGPDGALYVTTSNGTDDRIIRVTRSG
jgi:glucose/arabinose dehydrogenase